MSGKAKQRLGNTLTRIGAVVGMFGAVAMAIKLKIELTPEMQQVLLYKGTFAVALVLFVVGAWLGRRGRVEQEEEKQLAELGGPSEMPLQNEPVRNPDRRTTS